MRTIYKLTGNNKFDKAICDLENYLTMASKPITTKVSYNSALFNFIKYANKLPEECDKNEVIKIILNIQKERGFGSPMLKKYIFGIRYYLKHVVDRMDLHSKIPIPKTKKYDVEILNTYELNLLFDASQNTRNSFIIQLLFETGIRIRELLKIEFCDFDLFRNSLIIRNGKNGKTRTVYYGEHLKFLTVEYYNSSRTLFSHTMFNAQFHPFINLSRSGVRHLLKATAQKAGITKRMTPHLLRHAFAVHYLNHGGTLYQLQKLLGHNHMTTTLYYLQYAILPESSNISILDNIKEIYANDDLIPKRA